MMKRRLYLLLLLLLCTGGAASAAQDSIRRFEVFIDTDPGLGSGTLISVAAASQKDTVTQSFSLTVPAGITPGRHTLYLRSFADTGNGGGHWGLTQARTFWVEEKIIAAERFFDTDPGPGNGTPITITTPGDTVTLTASVSTASLSGGWHTLYTRTKSNSGQWGVAIGRRVYVDNLVSAGEYFFDNDPGIGSGTAFSIASPDDTVTQNLTIVTPANLPDGKHVLYVRTKSGSSWSVAQGRDFFVLPRINAAEYFFDNDPGIGNGTALSISTPSDTIANNFIIPTTGLGGGLHSLYVRTRTISGRWSIAQQRSFYVRPKIVAAEYYWDTDPGQGSGLALNIATQSDTVNQSYSIKAPCIAPGTHHLYVRTKDEFGHWAIAQEDTVTFSNPSVVATATYPGPGPYGTPVKVLGSGGTAPYTYQMGSGAASLDSLFLAANGAASVTFTATDTCGYSANTTISTPAKPTIIAGGGTGSGTVSLTGYNYWTYVQDGSGNIIGAVRDNRKNLGTVTISYLKNNSGTVRSYPVNNIKYLDRNWYVNSTIVPAATVGMQLFAVDSEYNALAAADPAVTSKSSLKITKYNGANEDLSISNNSGSYQLISPDSVVTFTGQNSAGNGYALAFAVSSFSEFYESRNTAVALSLQSLDLTAAKTNAGVQLNWRTRGETNTTVHELSRKASSGDFVAISRQLPGNNADNEYQYVDRNAVPGNNYYRVTVEDAAGDKHYSQVVVVALANDRTLTFAPNPVRDALRISGLRPGDALELLDIAGHRVWQGNADANDLRINTQRFAAGIYLLAITTEGLRSIQRIEIVR